MCAIDKETLLVISLKGERKVFASGEEQLKTHMEKKLILTMASYQKL